MLGSRILTVQRSLLAGAFVLCAGWAIASLSFPFGWDQGILASVGDVVLAGGMPYRDGWDMKGPLAHLWFAAAQVLFGRGQVGIRVLDLALLMWSAVAIARAGARLTRPAAAPWIGVGLVLCHSSLGFFFTAQPDGAVALALALACAPLLPGPARPRQVVVAGFIVGLCTLVKPIFLLFLALPLLVAARRPDAPLRGPVGRMALVVGAAAMPIAIMLSWFAARGALDDLIEVHIRFAANYAGIAQLSARTRLTGFVQYLWSGPRAPALAFVVFGTFTAWRRSRSSGTLMIGWLLAGLILVVVQGKFFVYHWTVVFPPAILLIAVAIDTLLAAPPVPVARSRTHLAVLGWAAAAAIAAPLAIQPARDVTNWFRFVTSLDTPSQYYARFGYEDGMFSAADQMAAADYIRTHTAATDRVAILGYDAPVIYLSGRTNATRFSYALPLVGWRSSPEVRDRYHREFLDALRNPPVYIVVGLLFPAKDQALASFPEFTKYLGRSYVLERSFGGVDLYHRK